MYKDGVVTITDWNTGQATHPIYGFGVLKNVEVFENKGIAKLKNRAVLRDGNEGRSSITPTALPIAEVYDIYGNIYTLTGETGSGVCYKNGVAIQSSLSIIGDLVIYKDYLFHRGSTTLNAYGPLSSGGATWFGSVASGFASGYAGNF